MHYTEEKILELRIKLQRHFQELNFESGPHTYNVGDRKFSSVSSFIKKYTPFFDSNTIAGYVAKARGNKEGRYVDKSEILQEWEDSKNFACDLGTSTHLFGETYPVSGGEPTTEFEVAIVNFWNWLPSNYIPLCFELQMYCKKKGIAGTADIVLLNVLTGKLVIADYKTNKELFKTFKSQTLKAPFTGLLSNNANKYTIQLSFYQILIELIDGLEVEERWLIWLKPDATFQLVKTVDVRDTIEEQFNF